MVDSTEKMGDTQKLVVIMDGAYDNCREKWAQLAEKHNVRLVPFNGTCADDFFDLFDKKNIVAVAHTYPGLKLMDGFEMDKFRACLAGVEIMCHMGAGYDALPDPTILKEMGITASNAPKSVMEATANTALYLTIGAMRNFNALASALRRGEWLGDVPLAIEPEGKTLGVIGLGGIGALARDKMQSSLNLGKVQYFNRRRADPEIEKNAEYVDFDTLLKTSDIVFLSVPLNRSTYHLIDAEAFSKMKDGVTIVNTARGSVIDEQALVDALASGKVMSAGLDVFENEPNVHPELLKNQNVLLLPHVGTHCIDARTKMEAEVIDNIDAYLTTGKLASPIAEHV
ncbi:Glyoxylate reductase 1 [Wickerhamiella sorbophila]|uniref:Glyoxylate reductase 1 n=1 Tax=Wickerhamiella sorbophila TaxID=45607 RepID=A0A2T0FIN1_9ASCO|nr:Glyoxylate reductase 1 [Wickerhamiella sorbophila]PRT54861.1 Glyoxylate reductase 1 [Wickerhamiella sorbophila]